jgi:polysaccharide biosynthesis transport protein
LHIADSQNAGKSGSSLPPRAAAPRGADAAAPIKLTAVIGILWRRLWLIVLCTFLAAFVGWVYARSVPPVYKATARVVVDRTGPVIMQKSVDNDMLLQTGNFRRTQAEIIKSPSVIAKLRDSAALREAAVLGNEDGALGAIAKDLETKVGDDDLIYVSFSAKSPLVASLVANAIVEAYVSFVGEQRHTTTTDVLKILEKEKETQDADFAAKLKGLTAFRIANGGISVGEKAPVNPILAQLNQYHDALSRARLDLIEAQAVLEGATQLKDHADSLAQFLQGQSDQSLAQTQAAEIRAVRDQIKDTQKELQTAARTYTADHPQVRLLTDRLAELRKQLETAQTQYRDAILTAMREHVGLAQSRVEKLEQLVDGQRQAVESVNASLAQLELLEAEFIQAKNKLEIINARIKDLHIGDEAGVLNVRMLEAAAPDTRPAWPDNAKILRMAMAFGLLLGVVGALALETVDDRVRSVEVASEVTGLSALAVIPSVSQPEETALGTLVHEEPQSQFAEAFRTLRTGIFFGTSEGHRKIILVTSPLPGDGKSTITANLAQALAQVGKKTILLDCDFRRPRVHVQFGLANEHGLSSIISGQADLSGAVCQAVQENLDVLTCGPIPPNPAELLNSEALHGLLTQLSQCYDHIVIDSPPVLAVTDARIVAACADVTIMVLRADQTRKKAARQAREQLDSVGANTLGLVINGTPQRTDRYGYGGGYGSYGYYHQTPNGGKRKKKRASQPVGFPPPRYP